MWDNFGQLRDIIETINFGSTLVSLKHVWDHRKLISDYWRGVPPPYGQHRSIFWLEGLKLATISLHWWEGKVPALDWKWFPRKHLFAKITGSTFLAATFSVKSFQIFARLEHHQRLAWGWSWMTVICHCCTLGVNKGGGRSRSVWLWLAQECSWGKRLKSARLESPIQLSSHQPEILVLPAGFQKDKPFFSNRCSLQVNWLQLPDGMALRRNLWIRDENAPFLSCLMAGNHKNKKVLS